MRRRVFSCIVATVALLVLVRASHASYVVCGIGLSAPDCTSSPIPSWDAWPAAVPPTFGLGCIGYPSPGDGPRTPNVIPVDVSRERFKIEVGGQELAEGSFVDLHLTCGWPCSVDGGGTGCHATSLVRYVGPLLPGQKHRVTWTTGQTRDGTPPWCELTVSASGVVDAAVFPDASFDASLLHDSAGWIDSGSSVDSAIAFDSAGGLDAPVGVVPATDAAESLDLLSPQAADGAGVADGVRDPKASSSGCSCAMGARRDLAPGAVLLLLVLARRRIARPPVGRSK